MKEIKKEDFKKILIKDKIDYKMKNQFSIKKEDFNNLINECFNFDLFYKDNDTKFEQIFVNYDYLDDYGDIELINNKKEKIIIVCFDPDILAYFLYKYDYIV